MLQQHTNREGNGAVGFLARMAKENPLDCMEATLLDEPPPRVLDILYTGIG